MTLTADPADIRGWQRLDARTTTSGRIEDRDIARLAAIGVRHVINLAMGDHPEALADEASKLAAAGLGYTHIPVPFDASDADHYAGFKAALASIGDAAVHVHCIANFRVSAFYYRLHRERGMADGAARALMHRQWAPENSDDPRAAIWAKFIEGTIDAE